MNTWRTWCDLVWHDDLKLAKGDISAAMEWFEKETGAPTAIYLNQK